MSSKERLMQVLVAPHVSEKAAIASSSGLTVTIAAIMSTFPFKRDGASRSRDIGTITTCTLRLPVFRSVFRSFSNNLSASYVSPRSCPLSMK